MRVQLAAVTQGYHDDADTEFWTCLVFQSSDQRDAFMEKAGWETEEGNRFASGTKVAAKMGIELPPGPRWRPSQTPNPDMASMARETSGGPAEADPPDDDP